jgi:hypothetical protein
LHQFSDTNSIVAISWCPFEKEIVLACTEEKLLLLNVKKGEVGKCTMQKKISRHIKFAIHI